MSTIVSQPNRRDILLLGTTAVGLSGTALALWPFIDSMMPAKDVAALATTEVDISPIEEGQRITVVWRGKPVFIEYRSENTVQKIRSEKLRIYVILKQMKTVYKKRNGLLPLGFALTWGASRWGKKRETQEVTGEGGFVLAMVPIMINQGGSGKDLRRATLLSRPTLSKQIIFSRLDKKRYE